MTRSFLKCQSVSKISEKVKKQKQKREKRIEKVQKRSRQRYRQSVCKLLYLSRPVGNDVKNPRRHSPTPSPNHRTELPKKIAATFNSAHSSQRSRPLVFFFNPAEISTKRRITQEPQSSHKRDFLTLWKKSFRHLSSNSPRSQEPKAKNVKN